MKNKVSNLKWAYLATSLLLLGSCTSNPVDSPVSSSSKDSESSSTSQVTSTQSNESSSTQIVESSSTSDESTTEITSSSSSSKPDDPVQQDGSIVLNASFYPDYSVTPYEMTYGKYKFEFANTSENENGYISFSKGGYMYNITPFGDIDSFTVKYSVVAPAGNETQDSLGFGSLYYVTDDHIINTPASYGANRLEVVSNQEVTLNDNPNFISFYTFNEIDIESITINYNTTSTYVEQYENFNINLFGTNDIHGQVNPNDKYAGLVNAAGYIEAEKVNSKYNLLLDQGDIYQGSLACYLTGGHVMDDFLLTSGYDSTILGNHEWDWTETNIGEHREYSPFVKLLACNVRYKDGSTPSWVKNYYITQRGGIKIGVIGAIGDIANDISADMIENIKFIADDTKAATPTYALTNMISGFADELKAAGCSYVILQIHQGSSYSGKKTEAMNVEYSDVDYSKLADKVNLVMEGHSHKAYYHVDSYGIPHVQCGGNLSAVGKLTLNVTYSNNKPTVTLGNVYFRYASSLKNDSSTFFNTINEWYSENVYKEESEKVVATLPTDLNTSQLKQLGADAYYDLKDVYSELSSYDIVMGGGHINARSPGELKTGNVTMSDVANIFPFDNSMYLVKINGKDLKYGIMNNTSNVFAGTIDASTTLNFSKDYYVLLDSYNYFYQTKVRKPNGTIEVVVDLTAKYGIFPRDVVAMYLTKNYPVKSSYTVEVKNTNFNFDENFSYDVKEGVNISVTHSNLANNASYNQITVKKQSGYIKFVASTGYKITSIAVDQYQNFTNLKYYSNVEETNELTYTVTDGKYTLTNTTDTFVVKNPSNYDVKINSFKITLEKAN